MALTHDIHRVVDDEYEFRGIERPAETTEAEILRDADNLDAMGTVGIARNFAYTGVVGNPLWDPSGQEYSGVGHFYDKLLELKDEMNTERNEVERGAQSVPRESSVLGAFEIIPSSVVPPHVEH